MLAARIGNCCVANVFSTRLKLIWTKSSLKTTKKSKKRIFLQKALGVNGPLSICDLPQISDCQVFQNTIQCRSGSWWLASCRSFTLGTLQMYIFSKAHAQCTLQLAYYDQLRSNIVWWPPMQTLFGIITQSFLGDGPKEHLHRKLIVWLFNGEVHVW